MKRMLAMLMVGCLWITPLSVHAGGTDQTEKISEESAVESCIEEFFYSFENIEGTDDVSERMSDIEELSVLDEVGRYEAAGVSMTGRAAARSTENATFLEMVELLLQRREIIEKTSDIDLTEYQKTLDLTVEDVDIEGDKAEVCVKVLKEWHYSFSPEVGSAAEDKFVVSLEKEAGEWKISAISGLADIVMDETLSEMGDEITSREREEYINEIADEYDYDLEMEDTYEENTEEATVWYTSPSGTKAARATSGYNNTAAISYALQYAITPNSSYADFSGSGGDCTNFISQCLYAGGIKQHTGTAYSTTCWFYKTSTNRSATWTGANEFRTYVTGSSSKIDMTSSSWSSVVPGDIIQLVSSGSAYHSLFVSGLAYSSNGRSDLLVCAHTVNRSNVSLAQYYGSSSKVYYHINGSK